MKKQTQQNQQQNSLSLSEVVFKTWFERARQEPFDVFSNQSESLSIAKQSEKKLQINFSDWNLPQSNPLLLIEEYLWGVRYGVSQFVNVDRCSFSEVLEVARGNDLCEIYSPAKVQYFSDGSRKVIPHNKVFYNTDTKFSDWSLINLKQAQALFPKDTEIFEQLPKETKFLCSPGGDKLRIASQEFGEKGFSFHLVDIVINDIAFYLGGLRQSFRYIAQEIEQGKGWVFCNPNQMENLDYLKSKICLMSGGKYPYSLAQKLVSESCLQKMRSTYIQNAINGKEDFLILIDGSYQVNDYDFNRLIIQDGADIKICVPPSVYQSWGQEFSPSELEIINRNRNFEFNNRAEEYYCNKINRLRFTQREINIFAEAKSKQTIIKIATLHEIITRQLVDIALQQKEMERRVKYSY